MPARKGAKCKPRQGGGELTAEVEMGILHPGTIGPKTGPAYERIWATHGEAYTRHYIKQMPGARPWPAYFVGDLAPLPLVTPPGERSRELVIDGVTWYEGMHYGKAGIPEIEHLLAIGEIDTAEAEMGYERVARYQAQAQPYQWLTDTKF